MGLLIAVESDMSHLGHRNERQHPVQHTHTGTKYRHNSQFAARNLRGTHLAYRSFYFLVGQRQIPRDFIPHKQGNLSKQLSEILGSGVLVPHNGQLVLNHWVVDDVYSAHIFSH